MKDIVKLLRLLAVVVLAGGAGYCLSSAGLVSAAHNAQPASFVATGNGGGDPCREQIEVEKHRWKRDFGGQKQVKGWEYSNGSWHNRHNNEWYTIPPHLNPPFYGDIPATGTVSLANYGGPNVTVQYRYPTPGTEWYPSETGWATEAEFEANATGGGWSKVASKTFYEDGPPNGECNHPPCPTALVKSLAPGTATPILGEVWIKTGSAGPLHGHYSVGVQPAGYVIPMTFVVDGKTKDVSHADVCPTQPPVDEQTTSKEDWECGDTEVTITFSKTETPWKWDGDSWVPDPDNAVVTTWTEARPLTPEEVESCKPDDREPTFTEWTDEDWECGDTEVTQTRVRTDYTWVNTGGSTWELKTTETTETRTRPLTDEELAPCETTTTTVPEGEVTVERNPLCVAPSSTQYSYVVTNGKSSVVRVESSVLLTAGSPDDQQKDLGPGESMSITVVVSQGQTAAVSIKVDGQVVKNEPVSHSADCPSTTTTQPTTTTTVQPTTSTLPPTTKPSVPSNSVTIPATGMSGENAGKALGIASALLAAGLGALVVSRRRNLA